MDTWNRQKIGVGRTCGSVIIEQRTKVSRLRGVENVVRQCGKFKLNALINLDLT